MNVETLLYKVIYRELEELENENLGAEERKAKVDEVTKLLDRASEMVRLDIEAEDKAEARKFEHELKLKQQKEETVDRWVRNGIAVFGVVAPLAVTVWGVKASFKFEETGTITTAMGRGLISKLLPKMK